ncbi:unnamed protein product [Orchesella dallaii]|uniref:Ionotropic glutamate receptor C-terminal domain-containing protein n=1 Tax=Orchesella dallaii TaxID=48710 RepID=A0ABP1QD42_9HEXA
MVIKIDNELFVPHASLRSRITALECVTCFEKGLDRGNFRFSNTFNVVISPLENFIEYKSLWGPVEDLWNVLVPSRSLFIYVWENNPERYLKQLENNFILQNWNTNLRIFAALKLILTLPSDFRCSARGTGVTIMCSGYCSSRIKIAKVLRLLWEGQDFYSIHHGFYWNANGKHVPGVIPLRASPNTFANLRTYINGNLNGPVMSLLTLASAHNLTISFHRRSLDTKSEFEISYCDSGLEAVALVSFTSYYPCFIGQLYFQKFDSFSVMYCSKIKDDGGFIIRFGTWYNPFSAGVWITILGFMVFILGVLVTQHNHNNVEYVLRQLVTYISWISGANIRPRHFIITWAVVFILSQLYVNGLTSLVTVATVQQGYKTLKDFIVNNYKIAFKQSDTSVRIEQLLKEEFKYFELPIEDAFKIFNNNCTYDEIFIGSTSNGTKIGLLYDTSELKHHVLYYNNVLRKNNSTSFRCFGIDQTFKTRQHHWYMRIENYHWLMISMQRLMQSGLLYMWDEWSSWHHNLLDKLLGQSTSAGPDFIDLSKILGLLGIWWVCMLISIAVLCFEIHPKIGNKFRCLADCFRCGIWVNLTYTLNMILLKCVGSKLTK